MLGSRIHARKATNANYTLNQLGGQRLGHVVWVSPPNDALGWRGYRLIQVLESGGMSARELCTRVADITLTGDDTSGDVYSTTRFVDTNAFSQDPTVVGDLFVATNASSGAGVAPEGEFAVIKYQDETGDDFIDFETDFPLSAAMVDTDTASILRMWRGNDAADGDLAFNVLGVNPVAVTANYYTYTQCYGICQTVYVAAKGAPQAAREACVAGAVGVGEDEVYAQDTVVGCFLAATNPGADGTRTSIFIDVLFGIARTYNALQINP
jgi:hypothetical protein